MTENMLPKLSEAEAYERLDELLTRTEQGESFLITRNGRPIAILLPPDCADIATLAEPHEATITPEPASARPDTDIVAKRRALDQTLSDVRTGFSDVPAEELEALIDEAVAAVRRDNPSRAD